MRSADPRRSPPRAAAAFAVSLALAALAGCDTLGNLMPGSSKAGTPEASAASAPGASASAPGGATARPATPTAAAPAPAASLAPVSPAAQRAFDDALALLRANRTADAERAFRALAQSDPDLAGPHANLGLIARNAGRLPEAVTELERATKLDPRLAVAWNQLAIAYRQQGQFAKSRTAYETALAIDPAYASAVLNLGILNDLYLGEPARALELYNRYLELTPAGDPTVVKWVAELKNRKPEGGGRTATATSAPASAPKEKQ